MDTLPKYKDILNGREYSFDCPVGVWRARLDAKAWGKQRNILLYLSELETANKYCISIFRHSHSIRTDGGFDFRREGQPGQLLELETGKTRTDRVKLMKAKIVAPDMDDTATSLATPEALTPAS